MGGSSIFSYLGTVQGAVTAAIVAIVISAITIIAAMKKLNVLETIAMFFVKIVEIIGKIINKNETKLHRDLIIGKIDDKITKVRIYRFLNELTIDLGLKHQGVTPYMLLTIFFVSGILLAIIVCQLLFQNLWLVGILFPICFAGIICIMYTKANISHDQRIDAILESENIICTNIKDGVVPAIKGSIEMIPMQVRMDFKDFLDNVEYKNYHIKTALLELGHNLGSISEDFIKKCIGFELEEEHGLVGMFADVIEVNNIHSELRIAMKRKFEEVTHDFIISAVMIFVFLGGVMVVYPNVADFYLKNPIGQLILSVDALVLISEFVYITYLRAKEL